MIRLHDKDGTLGVLTITGTARCQFRDWDGRYAADAHTEVGDAIVLSVELEHYGVYTAPMIEDADGWLKGWAEQALDYEAEDTQLLRDAAGRRVQVEVVSFQGYVDRYELAGQVLEWLSDYYIHADAEELADFMAQLAEASYVLEHYEEDELALYSSMSSDIQALEL